LAGGVEIGPRATVTISNSVISANQARPTVQAPSVTARCPGGPCPFAYGGGGGIDNWGKLTLVGTTVSDNVAGGGITAQADGGGILNESGARLTLLNSTVKGNGVTVSAPNGRFAAGGAIYVDGGTLAVRGSKISANRAEMAIAMPPTVDVNAACAAICIESRASATIRGTLISANVVSGSNSQGNGVWCGGGISTGDGGSFSLANSTVSNNRVTASAEATSSKRTTSGAALVVAGAVSPVSPNAVITKTVFSGNSAKASSDRGSAVAYGGAIANGNALALRRSRVTGNSARAESPNGVAHGGGIFDGQIPGLDQPGRIRRVASVVARNTPDQCYQC
jgi:hypothetical protein